MLVLASLAQAETEGVGLDVQWNRRHCWEEVVWVRAGGLGSGLGQRRLA